MYTGSVFSLSEYGCSSGSVSCNGVDEVMWQRFITGRPEEDREANVAQVCCSCVILPPAVFHLSSTTVAVLLHLYLRLICHRVVLTFTTAFTVQTKKASALTVQQQRTFSGVLAASAGQDQSPPLLHANTLMENGQTCYCKETDGAMERRSEDSTLTPADEAQEGGLSSQAERSRHSCHEDDREPVDAFPTHSVRNIIVHSYSCHVLPIFPHAAVFMPRHNTA